MFTKQQIVTIKIYQPLVLFNRKSLKKLKLKLSEKPKILDLSTI